MTLLVWWLVLGYFPTSIGAVLAIVAFNGPYAYRPRHVAPGGRRARTSTFDRAPAGAHTPEVLARRATIEATAVTLLERSAAWNEGPPDPEARERRLAAEAYLGIEDVEHVVQLERHEGAAGSPAYLAITARGVARVAEPENERERVELRDERITTADMTARFGAELGPALARGAQLDEWLLPDEDGEDPGAGRHARGRRRAREKV